MTMTTEQRKSFARQIESTLASFYQTLDNLAPLDVDSREWLGLVRNVIGSGGIFEGYEEWVQETWEPLNGPEVLS